jgi:hypothetical protein
MALFASFGTDAYSHRNRLMGWLAVTCLLVGLRHGVLAIGVQSGLSPDLVEHSQSLLVALGFIALSFVISALFPRRAPRLFPAWVALAMVPSFFRNLVPLAPGSLDTWLHHVANATYVVGCGFTVYLTTRARKDGDLMGERLFLGILGVTFPVVVEVVSLSIFDTRIPLSGFSLVILAMAIGSTRQWLTERDLEARIGQTEREAAAWRSLVPGTSFSTGRASPAMEGLFGAAWPDRVKALPEGPLAGSDGHSYRIWSLVLPHSERPEWLGWYERLEEPRPGPHGFLSGWTIGLGMDHAAESARLQTLLRSWGAEVQLWGTVPPREGPFPSVLLWAREPSILAVWREDDLARRRPRWIQIGGPITRGPHARLEPGASEEVLQRTLEGLLSGR